MSQDEAAGRSLGTWSSFRERMLRGLPRQVVPPDAGPAGSRPLQGLTTQASDDPTVALVDAFAAVCDVLTFYQERILAEGFLSTATEDRSVREILAGLGYEPGPGVAATADLSFTVDPAHDGEVVVPAGHAVLSVPAGQGELPVTFETTEELRARAEWNALPARRTRQHTGGATVRTLHLAGLTTGLVPGDGLVLRSGAGEGDGAWALHPATAVTPDPASDHTIVTLGEPLTGTALRDGPLQVVAFAGTGGLFGWNAPDPRMLPSSTPGITPPPPSENAAWIGFGMANDRTLSAPGTDPVVDLDREYPEAIIGGLICLHGGGEVQLYRVKTAAPAARVDFALSGRVTRVTFGATDPAKAKQALGKLDRRGTRVLLGSRVLPTVDEPNPTPLQGRRVPLAEPLVVPLPAGRPVLVVGEGTDGRPRVVRTQVADGPELTVDDELPPLRRPTVVVHANVVLATHGATVPEQGLGPGGTVPEEVLGCGDAAVDRQSFTLRHKPLTFVAVEGQGVEPALTVRIDGVRWDRVDSLYTAGPRDRVYLLRREHDDSTTVVFGDGRRGARVPTGVENVRATYRAGIGTPGRLGAGQLSLLRNRPLGLQGVTNPAPTSGAADPERPDTAGRSGTRTGVALDRLVSLADYGTFAAAFPGIGKALASDLHDGRQRVVHLTVAGAAGEVLDPDGPLTQALHGAVRARQDPAHLTVVDRHVQQPFTVRLTLLTEQGADAVAVGAAARAALTAAFSFPARQFGQPVAAAEVVGTAQRASGVVAVDLETLTGPRGPAERGVLLAHVPRWDGVQVTPAELLLLDLDSPASRISVREAP
ncbi:hypothetical protein [Geodermatophilus sp. SYSU D00710]